MAEKVELNKKVYGKVTYPNVINTEFSQLIKPQVEVVATPVTVEEFFQYYDDLFYDIPISGDFNSHTELIKRSTEYVGVDQNTEEIDALLDEINQLRLENLTQQQTIDELTASK
jgi:hypothetical protein